LGIQPTSPETGYGCIEGVVTVGDAERTLRAGESVYVPVETRHRIANPGTEPLEIIEVQNGDYLGEDGIVRHEDVYGRA
jgi:mannose-1-phosphate guanylyltransferase/mannose-6-phosphate isomerase